MNGTLFIAVFRNTADGSRRIEGFYSSTSKNARALARSSAARGEIVETVY